MSRKSIVVLICGCLVLLLAMGVRYSFGLYLAPVSRDLALDFQIFSFAIALQNLLWGLSQPFTGAIADKYGSGRVIAIAGGLHVLGLLMLANADSAWDLHTGSGLILGLAGSGCTFAVVLGVVGRAFPPEKRSMAVGIAAAFGTMGQITVVPFSQYLISSFNWSIAFLAMAVLLAAIVPLAAGLTGKAVEFKEQGAGAETISMAVNEARTHSGFLYLTAGFFVCGFQIMFIIAHFPNFLLSQEMPPMLAGVAIAVIGGGNVIGTLLFGWLGGRYSFKYLLSGLYLLRSAGFAGFLMTPVTETSVLIFSAFIGILWLATIPLTTGLVGQIFGIRYMATLFGIVFLGHQLGSFLAIWLGGVVFDATGSYDLIWQIAIGLGLVAAVLHLPIADTPLQRAEPAAT